VPNTIHDVVMARADRLPEETKQTLQTAAVIGREVPFRLLRALDGNRDLVSQLRELSRLEFVYERVEPEGAIYVFRHALTQEAVYGSLLERHRRAYHGAVGRALEEIYVGRVDEVAELLAHHFGFSDEAEKAIDYNILAGERAQRRWANIEALRYFSDALHRVDAISDTGSNRLRRIDAVLKQAEVKFALGRHTEHIQALEEIRAIVDQSDDPRRRATWHYWTGFLHILTGGRPDAAIDHCNEAAGLAATAGLDEIKAIAESCLAHVYTVAGRLRDAVEVGERALSSFEARGNLWWAGRTLWSLSVAANCMGEWDAGVDYCRRALRHGTALNDLRLKAVSWLRTGVAHIARGDLERGVECCDEALAMALSPFDAALAKAVRGYGEIKAGRIDAGIAEMSEAFAWLESSQLRYTHLYISFFLAEGHLRRGDRSRAILLVDDVLNTSRKAGYLHFEGRACWLMAECLAADAPAAAEGYVETAMRILERVGARNDLAKAMVTLAAVRQRIGDAETARRLLDQAFEIFQALGTRDEPVRVEAALAALDRGSQIRLLGGGK